MKPFVVLGGLSVAIAIVAARLLATSRGELFRHRVVEAADDLWHRTEAVVDEEIRAVADHVAEASGPEGAA